MSSPLLKEFRCPTLLGKGCEHGMAQHMRSDCNASFDEGMHQATLKTMDMFFGRVMTTDELVEEMVSAVGGITRGAA